MDKRKLVLASSSPRRLELLRMIGLEPEVVPPQVDEIPREKESPAEFIRRITLEKGAAVMKGMSTEAVVVSADTAVILEGDIIGKPRSREHAGKILKSLSGRMHEVWTALALFHDGRRWLEMERTRVWFAGLNDKEIETYLDVEHYTDKAGAYAIQGRAALFVQRIQGCYFNVMGFPLRRFYTMCVRAEIPIFGDAVPAISDGSGGFR